MSWQDYFFGTGGAAIQNRTPTDNTGATLTGEAWSLVSGSFQITLTGSQSAQAGGTCAYKTNFAPSGTDYYAQCGIIFPGPAPTLDVQPGPAVRMDGSGHCYFAAYHLIDAALNLGVWRIGAIYAGGYNAGAVTWLASSVNTPYSNIGGTTQTVQLQGIGQNPVKLVLVVGGVTALTCYDYSGYQLMSPGAPGLYAINKANTNSTPYVNAYVADNLSSAAVAISISPTQATVYQGQNQQFTAIVSNTSNTAVTWNVVGGGAGGTITSNGLYTAPVGATGTDTVRVTSQADNTKHADATVTVIAANPYSLPGTTITEASTPAQQMQLRAHRSSRLVQENQIELWYLDTSNGNWYLFPIQPSVGTKATGRGEIVLTQSYRQPATLTCAFMDPQGLLTPENKGSAYNLNHSSAYDPLLDESRKVLLRVGMPCYGNLAPNATISAPSISNTSYLNDGLFGQISDNTANYASASPTNSNPFTITLDLGALYFLRHCVIRFASKVGTCTLPASVQVKVSQDNVSYTAFKPARAAGGAGGDCDDDYVGMNYEMIFADLDDVMANLPGNQARYVQFVITPTGSQTLYMDELAIYGASNMGGAPQGRTIYGHNLFVGYLGDKIEIDNAGNPSFTATDVLKKLQDNNENRLTAQYTNLDVGDIVYYLLTSTAYWRGSGTAYDAPFTSSFIGWPLKSQSNVGLTGMVYPVWQSQSQSMLGYFYELCNNIGWYGYADGNGAIQMVEPSYTQRTADRILIADVDGNVDVRNCRRHRTGKEIRNVWEVSSGKQQTGGGRTEIQEPNSIAKYGRRRTIITDPVAITSDIQTKICQYGIREYAWRRNTLSANILPFFEDRPKKIHGLRASLRPYLHSKNNGSSWDRELWTLESLTHHIGFGTWDADVEYAPYYPQGASPPTVTGLSQTNTSVTINWSAITDPSVSSINIYRSTTANGTTGVPEAQPWTFSKLANVGSGTTTYTDSGLTTGQDYWYYLTTVDRFGVESVASTIYWARPGTSTSSTNDWIITDLRASFNQVQTPGNNVNYYTYEILLKWTSPGPTPDTGAGGTKRFNIYYALGSTAPSTADLSQWNYTDEWHGERVKCTFQPIGAAPQDQTTGDCVWYMRFRSLTPLSGQTAWVLLVTSDRTTSFSGYYRSNVCPVTLS